MAVSKKSLENLKNGKKFGPDHRPKNPGRKRSMVRDYYIEHEISLENMRKIFQGVIFDDKSIEDLMVIAKDKNTPALVSGLISAFLHDTKKGNLAALGFVMDRVYGRPVQAAVVEIQDMSEDTKKRMLSIFEEETKVKIKPKNVVPKRKPKPKEEL